MRLFFNRAFLLLSVTVETVQRNVRSWAANYALMNTDEKRIILPQLIEQIVVSKGYSVNIQFKAILASVDRIDKKE
jgi:hypothetical protein